jgi:hypothetical protein
MAFVTRNKAFYKLMLVSLERGNAFFEEIFLYMFMEGFGE